MDNKATPVDYYHDLGLERNASQRDIKVAYMKLARQHHPDKKLHSTDTAEFRKIQTAYETLHDPNKRAKYDKRTKAACKIRARRAERAQKQATRSSDSPTKHSQSTQASAAHTDTYHCRQRATPSTSAPAFDWWNQAPPYASTHHSFPFQHGQSSYEGNTSYVYSPYSAQSRGCHTHNFTTDPFASCWGDSPDDDEAATAFSVTIADMLSQLQGQVEQLVAGANESRRRQEEFRARMEGLIRECQDSSSVKSAQGRGRSKGKRG